MRRPVLEPTYVMRRRRTEALADLVREYRERQESRRGEEGVGAGPDMDQGPGTGTDYEVIAPGGRAGPGGSGLGAAGSTVDLATEEMPPVTAPLRPPVPGRSGARPRARPAVARRRVGVRRAGHARTGSRRGGPPSSWE